MPLSSERGASLCTGERAPRAGRHNRALAILHRLIVAARNVRDYGAVWGRDGFAQTVADQWDFLRNMIFRTKVPPCRVPDESDTLNL
jgi:hypothetical protein